VRAGRGAIFARVHGRTGVGAGRLVGVPIALVGAIALAACWSEAPAPRPEAAPGAPAPAAAYVGAERCAGCHAVEAAAWRGSHHDRAMEEASDASVRGDFADARFAHHGVVTRFFRRDGRFLVETEGADGATAEFEVAWTFGVEPLQQLLMRAPQGRVQALGVAWDARPADAGGQRWYALHDERVPPGDVLHWTGPAGRWNAQCAECHSTDVRRGYDLARDAYDTTWSEIDVACEACHGPGAAHVAWAEAAASGAKPPPDTEADRGLVVRLPAVRPEAWTFAPGAPIAHRAPPRREHTELETCAPCHARRSLLREGARPGEPLLDAFRPALLEAGLYEADGQIRDEVFEYGSFVQSRMHAAGVTCSDCHDPHSLGLRADGNALCGQCHRADVFDAPAHHRHAEGSEGAGCVACHMPARTYMGIDVRHDHSFRVPRPDLSVALGTPNACTDCHADRPATWAAAAVARWFPDGRSGTPHYGEALAAGRRGAVGAERALAALAADAGAPAIARATALSLLERPEAAAVGRAAADPEPLLRLGALEAAARLAPAARLGAVGPLLRDPLLAVRSEAARVLVDVPADLWRPADRTALADGLADQRAIQRTQVDLPQSHVNLALLELALGDAASARRSYETALRLAPWYVPAAVNLADVERVAGDEAAAEGHLRRALALAPDAAELHHALGLALVRTGRREEALEALARAAALAPESGRYAYVHALALDAAGQVEPALARLAEAHRLRPGDREVLMALATLSLRSGRREEGERWARSWLDAFPDDDEARALLAALREQGARE
jgi:predicted CXXCH cytochrome family protein